VTDEDRPPDDLIGREIDGGRYHVRELIGHGGMASVYLAHQRSVDRMVAVKFIQSRLLIDENLKRRFHREATVMASITSPHCATVFDFGETRDGLLYIIMEYLQGDSLATVLREEGPLRIPVFMEWMRQICAGVHAAHRKGLVHRDLKPENLFIEASPDGRRVKVLDFGLAKIIRGEEDAQETQGLTRPGLIFGTPQYMSPEQALGQGVDARTDVYALGLIAYECLTGNPAFDARTPQALLIAQATTPAPDVAGLRNDVSENIRSTIALALSKSADERFKSADIFYQALSGGTVALDIPETRSETLAMVSEGGSYEDASPASSGYDSLSPAVMGTAPPESVKTNYNYWQLATAFLVLLLGFTWWTLGAQQDHAQSNRDAPLAEASCSDQPTPPYDRRGQPCPDEHTASYWSFDRDFAGRAAGLPPRILKAPEPELVSLEETGVSGKAVRFQGESNSRLTGSRPFALGDRFTIEAWVYPHVMPDLGCGQFLIGTAQLKGSRQCHVLRISSGWGLVMRRVAPGQFEVVFHYMHRDLTKSEVSPTHVKLGGPTVLEARRWNHVAVVSDGAKILVMVNGRVKEFHRSPRIFEQNGRGYLTLGGYRAATNGVVSASLDEVRLSDIDRPITLMKSLYDLIRDSVSLEGRAPGGQSP
jgi:eukaryotic-like serine/threonine-protein kinase